MIHHKCQSEMICVQDFCGNGIFQGGFKHQINLWADWCPICKVIVFGGYWSSILDLPYKTEPDFDNCQIIKNHIKQHEPECEVKYQEWIGEA